jgi:transcriptional antiterminator NusG|tara:strand:+ start:1136 stop:1783 length:648 start_codon:yes stop_codon:yes gene_type:complete
MAEVTNSHLFTVRTTGGQERVVIRLLETRMSSIRNTKEELKTFTDEEIHHAEEVEGKVREEIDVFTKKAENSPEDEEKIEKLNKQLRPLELRKKLKDLEGKFNIQSILLVDNLKGYIVIEAEGPQEMFAAIQGLRHVKGQLRGELQYSEIENYLIKKSTVSELTVDAVVEIIGGPFKGMKATITRVDHEKEEATVILLDAPYQLPVTVDANYLKP